MAQRLLALTEIKLCGVSLIKVVLIRAGDKDDEDEKINRPL